MQKKSTDDSGCEVLDDGFVAHFAAITWVVDKTFMCSETVPAIVPRPIFGTDRIKSHDNKREQLRDSLKCNRIFQTHSLFAPQIHSKLHTYITPPLINWFVDYFM